MEKLLRVVDAVVVNVYFKLYKELKSNGTNHIWALKFMTFDVQEHNEQCSEIEFRS